jgi:hypothetical protein
MDLLALEQGHVIDHDVAHVADGDDIDEQSQTVVGHFLPTAEQKPTNLQKFCEVIFCSMSIEYF